MAKVHHPAFLNYRNIPPPKKTDSGKMRKYKIPVFKNAERNYSHLVLHFLQKVGVGLGEETAKVATETSGGQAPHSSRDFRQAEKEGKELCVCKASVMSTLRSHGLHSLPGSLSMGFLR